VSSQDSSSKEAAPPLPELEPRPGHQTGAEVRKLVALMQRLLAPDGCPWDREQTLETLVPYLVEETYEVVDALAEGTVDDHREELGDLLLQIIFQSELRFQQGAFGIDDVAHGIVTKLVRRHPHVFGEVQVKGVDDVLSNWAVIKAQEKVQQGKKNSSALDGIPRSAPALLAASRAGEKASAVGLDWPDAVGPRRKVNEELAELDEAVASGDRAAQVHELGDVLLSVVNLARKLGLDPEAALRASNARFGERFRYIETTLADQGRAIKGTSEEELDRLWAEAKRKET
jgi:MazG family protein